MLTNKTKTKTVYIEEVRQGLRTSMLKLCATSTACSVLLLLTLPLPYKQAFAFTSAASNSHELQAIAITIANEAGGEGYFGMYLVANTIANRAKLYHKTPYQIVSQPYQYVGFKCWTKGKSTKWYVNAERNRIATYNKVKPIADKLAQNIMDLKDKTGGAIYFRQLREPRFKWCKIETARYNHHIFYK